MVPFLFKDILFIITMWILKLIFSLELRKCIFVDIHLNKESDITVNHKGYV